nr:thioredoxin family protein [Methanohalophilus levihalophilus]
MQEKPVLITFGSESCGACQQQDTVLEYLEKMYDGSVYFVHIDVDDHPRLAGTFGVYAIPDTSVIVAEENGQYVYMDYYGNVSSERSASSRFGPSGVDTLSRVLDMSVDYRNNTSISLENP